jgi:competence protein ComGC
MTIMIAVVILLILFLMFAGRRNQQNRQIERPAQVDTVALVDAELQSYLPDNKMGAIKRYHQLTNAGLKESRDVIEWVLANPDALDGQKDIAREVDTQGAGIRDLVAEGRIEEAVKVYAAYMGVDAFSARDAVEQIERELLEEESSSTLGDLLSNQDSR